MAWRWRTTLIVGGVCALMLAGCGSGERRRATELQRAFDSTGFEPMPVPGPDDWLAQHPEQPQSFDDYLRADKNVPGPPRTVIYLLPIGDFPATAPPLEQLATIVRAFFMLDVRILPAVNGRDITATTRISEHTNK